MPQEYDVLHEEIAKCWQTLEESGFPPAINIEGELPNAINAALDCLIRQREDLLAEVLELRKFQKAMTVSSASSNMASQNYDGPATSALTNGDRK